MATLVQFDPKRECGAVRFAHEEDGGCERTTWFGTERVALDTDEASSGRFDQQRPCQCQGCGRTFDLIDLFYVMADETEISEITSCRLAEMILSDLSGRDTIIYADQPERHQVGPGGIVS